MKAVIIHGADHRGCSYHIGRMVLDRLGCDSEEFFLPGALDDPGKQAMLEAIRSADVLVFTTPTYCMRCSASMKRFMEATYTLWMPHRPEECMFSKRAVVVSTAAGAGEKDAVKDVTNMLFWWGVPAVKGYGVAVYAADWDSISPEKKARIDRKADELAAFLGKGKPKVGLKTRLIFGFMRRMHAKHQGIPSDTEYWRQKGWLEKKRPW